MESYNYLAEYYDMLMDDVDYDAWCSFIEDIFNKYGVKPDTILDAACGTGNITIPMAVKGYKLSGVDISDEMLAVAENKARSQKQSIKFLKQNLTELTLNKSYDSVLCMCDGVNYIIEEMDLKNFFSSVYKTLSINGVFVFDISSSYKLKEILGDNTLFQEKDDFCYVWENSCFEDEEIIEMRLNFFVPENGLYKRLEEYHTQRIYSIDYLRKQLHEAGFRNISAYDDLAFREPNDTSQRIFFTAQKI